MTVPVRTQLSMLEDQFAAGVLGYPVWGLKLDGLPEIEVAKVWEKLLQQAGGERGVAYSKARVGDAGLNAWLAAQGGRLVDTNVQLQTTSSPLYSLLIRGVIFRFAESSDEESVSKIAHTSFPCSRWHRDELISPEQADALKEEWARNFWRGERGDYMIVAECDGRVVGFHQVVRQDRETLLVDLIAVDQDFRGRGIGAGLVRYAIEHCGPLHRMLVGTQLMNRVSLAMYLRCGFHIISARHIWHLHFPARGGIKVK